MDWVLDSMAPAAVVEEVCECMNATVGSTRSVCASWSYTGAGAVAAASNGGISAALCGAYL